MWNCSCGFYNFAHRSECFFCRKPTTAGARSRAPTKAPGPEAALKAATQSSNRRAYQGNFRCCPKRSANSKTRVSLYQGQEKTAHESGQNSCRERKQANGNHHRGGAIGGEARDELAKCVFVCKNCLRRTSSNPRKPHWLESPPRNCHFFGTRSHCACCPAQKGKPLGAEMWAWTGVWEATQTTPPHPPQPASRPLTRQCCAREARSGTQTPASAPALLRCPNQYVVDQDGVTGALRRERVALARALLVCSPFLLLASANVLCVLINIPVPCG